MARASVKPRTVLLVSVVVAMALLVVVTPVVNNGNGSGLTTTIGEASAQGNPLSIETEAVRATRERRLAEAESAVLEKPPLVNNKKKEVAEDEQAPLDLKGGSSSSSTIPEECRTNPLVAFPLSPIEQELQRLAILSDEVMRAVNASYWPADATLLGLMRSGRVATDRDLDYSIHATFETCGKLLASLKHEFVKRGAKVKYFKVATTKVTIPTGHPLLGGKHMKIGRYGMVRVVREFGDFDTGPDFNCVYTDDPRGPSFYTHKGSLRVLPPQIFPLGTCLIYNRTIPCPRDGMAFLGTLAPRYDGCMVYPHCLGDPRYSHRDCLTPHPPQDLHKFVEATKLIDSCGYVSMAHHFETEPKCRQQFVPKCDDKRGLCFLQPFKD